ncbi:MAG: undecaprenyl-diphosphate phosphatase [Fidelibacterota bacterium]
MNILDALILGTLQGLTEFLPISSSGHLVIGQHILGLSLPGNIFEVIVHLGTLCSVLLVFKNEILELIFNISLKKNRKLISAIIIGTIPAVIVGLVFKENIRSIFDNISTVSFSLILTGAWLIMTKLAENKNRQLNIKSGLLIGCIQAVAIIPGISRSGTTIGMAMFLGISPQTAAKFSFLLAVPAIAGAGLLSALDIESTAIPELSYSVILSAFVSSFLVGWASLRWLLRLISKGKFHWFGVYCIFIGLITVLIG